MILKKSHPWGWADLINDTHPEWGNLLRTFPLFSWCSDPFCMQRSIRLGPYAYMGGDNFYWVDELGIDELGVDESGVDEPGTHLAYHTSGLRVLPCNVGLGMPPKWAWWVPPRCMGLECCQSRLQVPQCKVGFGSATKVGLWCAARAGIECHHARQA